MRPLRIPLIVATFCSASIGFATAQPAPPPPNAPPRASAPVYDPQQLPATKGTVARYTLTPRGDVDGVILAEGTEVHFPPHLSTQLVYAIKPGDAVTIRGLKALSAPLIAAISITNDATGSSVFDVGPGAGPGPKVREARQAMSAQGRVQMSLHGPRGELNGAMLEDGTILRLPPPEAERLAALLMPGQTIVVQGDGLTTPMGPGRRGAGDWSFRGTAEFRAAPWPARATSVTTAHTGIRVAVPETGSKRAATIDEPEHPEAPSLAVGTQRVPAE